MFKNIKEMYSIAEKKKGKNRKKFRKPVRISVFSSMAFLRSILVASAVGSQSPLSMYAFESKNLLYMCRAQQQSHPAEPAAIVLKSCHGACTTSRIVCVTTVCGY